MDENLFKKWFEFRSEILESNMNEEDINHLFDFEDVARKILENVLEDKVDFVADVLKMLEDDVFDYISYWTDKYYREGLADGIQLIGGNIK